MGPGGEVDYPSAILDTGATHSIIPADDAERIGLFALGEEDILTASGRVVMAYTMVGIWVDGCNSGTYKVLLGPPGDEFSVGFDVISACQLLKLEE